MLENQKKKIYLTPKELFSNNFFLLLVLELRSLLKFCLLAVTYLLPWSARWSGEAVKSQPCAESSSVQAAHETSPRYQALTRAQFVKKIPLPSKIKLISIPTTPILSIEQWIRAHNWNNLVKYQLRRLSDKIKELFDGKL